MVVNRDLAVPQQWSYRVHKSNRKTDSAKNTQTLIFSIRKATTLRSDSEAGFTRGGAENSDVKKLVKELDNR